MPFYKYRSITAILATLLWMIIASAPAFAACSNPAREAAAIIYNADQKLIQYCDNTNWIPAGLPGSGSGGCSSPSRDEGTILYNTDSNVMQFCGGNVWVPMGFPASASDLSNGLVGHWKLDESSGPTAVDSSPSGNNGTYTNTPTPTTGRLSNALDFSGELGSDPTHDLVNIGDPADGSLDFGSGSFSYGLWVYVTATAGTYDFPWSKGGGCASCEGYDMEFGSGSWTTYVCDGDECSITPFSASPFLNSWTHFMVVFDRAAGNHYTYVNGALVNTDPISGTFGSVSNTTSASIGASSSGNNPFLGQIDDMRIYNRALTAAEVAALAAQGNALVAHYKLDESSGTSAADSSGYANTGTLQGAPYSSWSAAGGRIGGALRLDSTDGSSTYLDGVNAPAAAQINNLSAKTIAAWVKVGPDNETVIAQKYGAGNDDGWLLRRVNDTDISFTNWFSTVAVDVNWSGVLANDDTWHHVALTFPGASTDNASLYVNGALVSSTGATSGSPMGDDSSAQLKIGNHGDWPSAAVDGGYLDDVRIYNYVLSGPEIGALAAVGADTTTGLQGHWKLDESSGTSAADSSGNGNTGTTSGSPAWTTGQVDGALDFDGTNDDVTVAASASLNDLTTITIAGWMKPDIGPTGARPIAYKGYWGNIGGFALNYMHDTKRAQFTVDYNSGAGNLYAETDWDAWTNGVWQHIAITWDGTQNASGVHLYRDGVDVGRYLPGDVNGSGIKDSDAAKPLIISDSTNPFSGLLDDMRIYNRVLSGADVATLAQGFPGDCNGPKGLKGEMIYNSTNTMLQYCDGTSWVAVGKNAGSYASDMIAHWKFDETSGTSAADSTGNGNTGTLTNSPAWQGTAGKRGGAILLDGVNDYVTAGDINAAEGIGSITVSTWVNHSVAGETQHVYKSNCDGANDSWEIYSGYPNTDGTAAFMVGSSDGTFSNSGSGTTDTSDGSWHMLTGVYDGAYIRIYVDGVEESSTSYPGITIYNSAHNVEIGGRCNGGGSGHYVNGLMDEVRIYGRALSPSEITDLYNATNGTPGPETRTVFLATNSGAKYNGNLGGLAGANTKCNTEATAAGLLGTYRAWISLTANATNDPDSLFTGVSGSYNYLLPTGTKVADNWADLIDGSLDAAINENASGTSQASGNVWTNVTTAGARDGSTSNTHGCATWGTALNTRSGNIGTAGNTDNTWTDTGGTSTCDIAAYLYCFQQ